MAYLTQTQAGQPVLILKEGTSISVKEQAIKSASEAASMILRIDDVISSSKPKTPKGPGEESESEFD